MAASRRGQPELHVRLPPRSLGIAAVGPTTGTSVAAGSQLDLPPISALFLIEFDVKAGYTLSWKAAAHPDIELEGVVEYKSLPSGLHTVPDDLIYFVHEGFAGLSAFVNAPVEDSAARNARMLAVGVLVPLSYGRLGRAWRHAEGLKELATKMAMGGKDTSVLEQYWAKNQARDDAKAQLPQQEAMASKESLESSTVTFQEQPKVKTPKKSGHTRNRSASDGAGLLPPGHKLSAFHPAWSLVALLDTFGPLIFPIHRAALLRKRILISCHTPVQRVCNFVYDISILSNIPLPTYDQLPLDGPPHRLRPLFTIGVHDIPSLMADDHNSEEREFGSGPGWIACTTDSILAMKDTLWDMLITLPPAHASNAKHHVWPTVECPRGNIVMATQRDFRRYKALRSGLLRLHAHSNIAAESPDGSPTTTPRILAAPQQQTQDDPLLDEAELIVEPLSWAALAYNGFMWWASAGEQARSDEAEEHASDVSLLADEYGVVPGMMNMSSSVGSLGFGRRASSSAGAGNNGSSNNNMTTAPSAGGILPPDEARVELAIIAYFHRLTTQILAQVADIVDSSSDDLEDDDGEEDGNDDVGGAGDGDDDDDDDALLDPIGGEHGGGRGIKITSEALREMGLDRWSVADREFVKEVVDVYFGRVAYVEGKKVEVCGVRMC